MNKTDKLFFVDCLTFFVFIELLIAGAVLVAYNGSLEFGLCLIIFGLIVNQLVIYKVKRKC